MAAARDTTAKNIKPLTGAIVRRYTAGGAVSPGQLVSINSSGYVVAANTATITLAKVAGVALGDSDAASGDRVDVVVHGPVQCMTGSTIGATIYATDTAGALGETAGTKTSVAGHAESATVLFVRPFQTVFA